jgi:hypothetical protein
MKHALMFAILFLVAGEGAMAQGVSQSPATTTVNQQRQNGATVAPNSANRTSTQTTGFSSPFTSPFGTSGASNLPAKGGYAGNGVNH